jgi:hypothetical protein
VIWIIPAQPCVEPSFQPGFDGLVGSGKASETGRDARMHTGGGKMLRQRGDRRAGTLRRPRHNQHLHVGIRGQVPLAQVQEVALLSSPPDDQYAIDLGQPLLESLDVLRWAFKGGLRLCRNRNRRYGTGESIDRPSHNLAGREIDFGSQIDHCVGTPSRNNTQVTHPIDRTMSFDQSVVIT